jgi:ABC-2 type transport system permease protein
VSAATPPPGTPFPGGTFAPDPGIGSRGRMLAVHTRTETLLALRHSEQLLLTLVIPLALLVGLTVLRGLVDLPDPRVNAALGTVLALAMMSTGFTSQAIALGFDRRYGLMRRLAATAIPRWLVITGRLGGMAAVVVIQVIVLGGVALLLGWRPEGTEVGWALLLVVLGAAAFGACGLLLGGAVRADLVLVIANVVWFVLLFVGGIVVPADQLPGPLGAVVELLPSGALAEGLRSVLLGGTPGVGHVVVLVVWGVVAGLAAARTLRWD